MPDPGTVLWVGGWASNLACWKKDLEALYPGRAHVFLDAHALLEGPGPLSAAVADLPPGSVLAAWSLGSLLVHRALGQGILPVTLRVVSFSPIFDFCRPGGPTRAAVERMIRNLPRARAAVLADFWKTVKGGSSLSPALEKAWSDQAAGYSLDSLVAGLEALLSLKADPDLLDRSGLDLGILASPADPLSPHSDAAGLPKQARILFHARGHLPFLDCPRETAELLKGKVRA